MTREQLAVPLSVKELNLFDRCASYPARVFLFLLGMHKQVVSEAVASRLAEEIRTQSSFHDNLITDLKKLASCPAVTEEDFHATFLKALGRSGLETK